jgi:hypothetical protein
MSDTCELGPEAGGSGVRRRRFLRVLGSGGLAAAAAVFARPEAAEAACSGSCCNLVYCPPNTSFSSCINYGNHYLWACALSSRTTCRCCEKRRRTGGFFASAYSCRPT